MLLSELYLFLKGKQVSRLTNVYQIKFLFNAFYQALNKLQNNHTKMTYEIWREKQVNTDYTWMQTNYQMLDETY